MQRDIEEGDILGDIDLVYLWCDGSDESWSKLRFETAAKHGISLNTQENGQCRVSSHDELKYSLRSIEMHCPWIRYVFLVIPDMISCPSWLNTDNPKLKIIHESEIVPAEYYPCFCSPIIEHHLGFIPDLSETFLYSNDDMFVVRDLQPDFFFDADGLPIVRLCYSLPTKTSLNYNITLLNAFKLIEEKNNGLSETDIYNLKRFPHHGIDAYRKSHYLHTYYKYKDSFHSSFSIPFRSDNDIQRMLYGWEEVLSYGAKLKKTNYLALGSDSVLFVSEIWKSGLDIINRYKPGLACFNSDSNTNHEKVMWLKLAMDVLFPLPSSFEK